MFKVDDNILWKLQPNQRNSMVARLLRIILLPSYHAYHISYLNVFCCIMGFPSGADGKESTCQGRRHRRHGFDPWVGKSPWSRKWQPTPVLLPGKFHGQRSLARATVTESQGHRITESDTTEHAVACCIMSFHDTTALCERSYYYHLTGENTETQRG